jgi:hypothetical protein
MIKLTTLLEENNSTSPLDLLVRTAKNISTYERSINFKIEENTPEKIELGLKIDIRNKTNTFSPLYNFFKPAIHDLIQPFKQDTQDWINLLSNENSGEEIWISFHELYWSTIQTDYDYQIFNNVQNTFIYFYFFFFDSGDFRDFFTNPENKISLIDLIADSPYSKKTKERVLHALDNVIPKIDNPKEIIDNWVLENKVFIDHIYEEYADYIHMDKYLTINLNIRGEGFGTPRIVLRVHDITPEIQNDLIQLFKVNGMELTFD